MGKRVVICLDGTSNEPEKDKTNVARLFDMLVASIPNWSTTTPGSERWARAAQRRDSARA